MIKFNKLAIAFDTAQIEKAHKLIDTLSEKLKKYNKQVEQANKLLREHENLRKGLNISIDKGKVKGLSQ